MCAAHPGMGHRGNPQLISIQLGGPFERVSVNIMELPQTNLEHRYMIVFEDNITEVARGVPS